jgi:hypothetical protein
MGVPSALGEIAHCLVGVGRTPSMSPGAGTLLHRGSPVHVHAYAGHAAASDGDPHYHWRRDLWGVLTDRREICQMKPFTK